MILPSRTSIPAVNTPEARAGRRSSRRATATVEFAALAPFLATLILGSIEISRALMVKNMLSDSARRGCRVGIVPGKATSDITTYVNYNLTQQGLDTTQVTTAVLVNGKSADASTANSTDKISVQVAIPASAVSWVATHYITGTTLISETVVMMRQ
jgi:Flp pilus assembly protein TadG